MRGVLGFCFVLFCFVLFVCLFFVLFCFVLFCLFFCQTDNLRFGFIMYCYWTALPVYTWRELTCRNLEVCEIQFLTSPILSRQRRVIAKAGLPSETTTRNGINPIWDAIYINSYRLDWCICCRCRPILSPVVVPKGTIHCSAT